jgi:tetratricopeptide (TPR) repeat protein
MEGRKLALILCVAASCAGCTTEKASVAPVPQTLANLKGGKEPDAAKRDALPKTWVAYGRMHEAEADHQQQGSAQQNSGRDEARKAYQKAIELDPKYLDAYSALANLYANQEDYDRAIAVYQRGLKQNPNAPTLWFESGVCWCRKKDFPQALRCMGKAHELDPENHQLAADYGLCLARAGRPEDAVIVLSRVMNKAEANYNVARMMQHLNQPELMRQYLQVALHEHPTHQPSLQMLAQLSRPASLQPPVPVNDISDPALRQAAAIQGQ